MITLIMILTTRLRMRMLTTMTMVRIGDLKNIFFAPSPDKKGGGTETSSRVS
jgi:hypothetical protein